MNLLRGQTKFSVGFKVRFATARIRAWIAFSIDSPLLDLRTLINSSLRSIMPGGMAKFILSSRMSHAARSVNARKSAAVCTYLFKVFCLKGTLNGSLDIVLGQGKHQRQCYCYSFNKHTLLLSGSNATSSYDD